MPLPDKFSRARRSRRRVPLGDVTAHSSPGLTKPRMPGTRLLNADETNTKSPKNVTRTKTYCDCPDALQSSLASGHPSHERGKGEKNRCEVSVQNVLQIREGRGGPHPTPLESLGAQSAKFYFYIIPREARPKASRSGVYNFVPQRAQAG